MADSESWVSLELRPVGLPGELNDVKEFMDAMTPIFEPSIVSKGGNLGVRFKVDAIPEADAGLIGLHRLTVFFPPSRYRIDGAVNVELAINNAAGGCFTADAYRRGADLLIQRTNRTGDIVASILFVDIVGSTELISRIGDRPWVGKLLKQRKLTRHLVRRARGRLVNIAGDGFLILVPGTPSTARQLTHELMQATHANGLALRAGLHWGQFSRIEDDIAGIELHAAARLLDYAGANEIVFSGPVRDLVDATAEPLGPKVLKGVLPPEWLTYRAVVDVDA